MEKDLYTRGLYPYAPIEWQANGHPYNQEFDYIYFTKEALSEISHVFHNANQLQKRWKNPHLQTFFIAETGFGFGLNFLSTVKLWLEQAPSNAQLYYIAIEHSPIKLNDLKRGLSLFPEIKSESDELVALYPTPQPGQHLLILAKGRVRLNLFIGEAEDKINEISEKIDCWFLDGSSPTKSPSSWTDKIFTSLARLSHKATTLTTPTSASKVQKQLQQCGFVCHKLARFDKKREMLKANFQEKKHSQKYIPTPPWYHQSNDKPLGKKVIVIGAGLSGCSTALALAERGFQVSVLEQHSAPACEASGNRQGMLYMRLSGDNTFLTQLNLAGFQLTIQRAKQLLSGSEQPMWSQCGLIQLAYDKREALRQQRLIDSQLIHPELMQALSANDLSKKAGITLNTKGLWFPSSGWVDPRALSKKMLEQANIKFYGQTQAKNLLYQQGTWTIQSQKGKLFTSETVVIACNHKCVDFAPTAYLPLIPIRGQVTGIMANQDSQSLQSVICHKGYLAPAKNNQHLLGATFSHKNLDPNLDQKDNRENLINLCNHMPDLANQLKLDQNNIERYPTTFARVGFRCTTPDYLPIVGPIVKSEAFIQQYHKLAFDARTQFDKIPEYHPGLYVNTGHGARGLITAPLSAELLASIINKEVLPLSQKLTQALHPSRFLLRDLIHRRIPIEAP